MELEELRAEFVEQVMQLRRKVINRIRPKMLKGKPLNGVMLYDLMTQYVDSINNGAVPSIDSAWSYICKNECLKALQIGLEKFEEVMKENYEMKAPMYDDELKEFYKEAKKAAIDVFKKKAVGENQADFFNELNIKIKQKYSMYKRDNQEDCEKVCNGFLAQTYASIE